MKIVKLKKENLFPFLEVVSKDADLWAPVKKNSDRHVFKMIDDLTHINLDYTRTILPRGISFCLQRSGCLERHH